MKMNDFESQDKILCAMLDSPKKYTITEIKNAFESAFPRSGETWFNFLSFLEKLEGVDLCPKKSPS